MLKKKFYTRDSLIVAKELLGKKICFNGKEAMIVETEAYTINDPGSHAFNKPRRIKDSSGTRTESYVKTPRNSVMYNEGGCLYVYFCYGMFNMLNIVTDKENTPSAVLIRAVEPINFKARTNGPGLLTKALGINKKNNTQSVLTNELHLENHKKPKEIIQTTRIGIKEGSELPYRFYIKNNPYVSKN